MASPSAQLALTATHLEPRNSLLYQRAFGASRGFHPVSYLPLSDPTARPSQAEFNLQAKSGQLSQFRANTPQEEVRPDCNIDQADIIQ
ncbi:hypothetical protein AMECASPLE_011960 [Ameca splendens]|uniref:Uncharacterized protein n=1 Tax=Ameca splendens TaxID=208324 RepID=A0ABV0YCQ0_9TELE